MTHITIKVPEETPLLAVARFAAEMGCDTTMEENGNWTFTKVRDALPAVDVIALQIELDFYKRKTAKISALLNDLIERLEIKD